VPAMAGEQPPAGRRFRVWMFPHAMSTGQLTSGALESRVVLAYAGPTTDRRDARV